MMTIMVLWSFIYWGGVFFLLRLVLLPSFLLWVPTLGFTYKDGISRGIIMGYQSLSGTKCGVTGQ